MDLSTKQFSAQQSYQQHQNLSELGNVPYSYQQQKNCYFDIRGNQQQMERVSPQTVTDESARSFLTPQHSVSGSTVQSAVFPRSASEATFDSSSKFRQLPCRTFISVGTCPYRERCVYLHDPRCICKEARTKTRRKNKEDVVLDALFWPVMPCNIVGSKLDSNRQPHVIQNYSVPIPKDDQYFRHDASVYSMWMHFVDFCVANNGGAAFDTQALTVAAGGNKVPGGEGTSSSSSSSNMGCFSAPDLPLNSYTEQQRLAVFRVLSKCNGQPMTPEEFYTAIQAVIQEQQEKAMGADKPTSITSTPPANPNNIKNHNNPTAAGMTTSLLPFPSLVPTTASNPDRHSPNEMNNNNNCSSRLNKETLLPAFQLTRNALPSLQEHQVTEFPFVPVSSMSSSSQQSPTNSLTNLICGGTATAASVGQASPGSGMTSMSDGVSQLQQQQQSHSANVGASVLRDRGHSLDSIDSIEFETLMYRSSGSIGNNASCWDNNNNNHSDIGTRCSTPYQQPQQQQPPQSSNRHHSNSCVTPPVDNSNYLTITDISTPFTSPLRPIGAASLSANGYNNSNVTGMNGYSTPSSVVAGGNQGSYFDSVTSTPVHNDNSSFTSSSSSSCFSSALNTPTPMFAGTAPSTPNNINMFHHPSAAAKKMPFSSSPFSSLALLNSASPITITAAFESPQRFATVPGFVVGGNNIINSPMPQQQQQQPQQLNVNNLSSLLLNLDFNSNTTTTANIGEGSGGEEEQSSCSKWNFAAVSNNNNNNTCCTSHLLNREDSQTPLNFDLAGLGAAGGQTVGNNNHNPKSQGVLGEFMASSFDLKSSLLL